MRSVQVAALGVWLETKAMPTEGYFQWLQNLVGEQGQGTVNLAMLSARADAKVGWRAVSKQTVLEKVKHWSQSLAPSWGPQIGISFFLNYLAIFVLGV